MVFPVNGGTTYRIKVDGFAATNGLLNLHIENGPPPACFGVPATIVGTAGNDVINGTAGNDVIVAGDGNDIINGNGGNDRICGDAGNDTINGGDGRRLRPRWLRIRPSAVATATTPWSATPAAAATTTPATPSTASAGNDFLDGWFGDDVARPAAPATTASRG